MIITFFFVHCPTEQIWLNIDCVVRERNVT